MAELSLATLDVARRERLGALGFEVLRLRSVPNEVASPHFRLSVLGASFDGPSAELLRALIGALGLRDDEVATARVVGAPTLAFGGDAGTDAIAAPTLDALRSSQAKRALWPALRRLRGRFLAEPRG